MLDLLPIEILIEVLLNLTPNEVLIFSRTCKKYYNFILNCDVYWKKQNETLCNREKIKELTYYQWYKFNVYMPKPIKTRYTDDYIQLIFDPDPLWIKYINHNDFDLRTIETSESFNIIMEYKQLWDYTFIENLINKFYNNIEYLISYLVQVSKISEDGINMVYTCEYINLPVLNIIDTFINHNSTYISGNTLILRLSNAIYKNDLLLKKTMRLMFALNKISC